MTRTQLLNNMTAIPSKELEDNKKRIRKLLLKSMGGRWTQYQWENENQIDWKSVFIGAGFLLVVIGAIILL